MLTTRDVQTLLLERFPGAAVRVTDLTGTSDHFGIDIEHSAFAGKSLVDQHRLVHAALAAQFGEGRPIHALQIKTRAGR
jgi:stress-induced morphogen